MGGTEGIRGIGAGGTGDKDLPRQEVSWAVIGNSERTGFNLPTDTSQSCNQPEEKSILEFEKPPGMDLCRAKTEDV